MQAWTEWSPSSRTKRWKRRKKKNPVAQAWTRFIAGLLVLAVSGAIVWEIKDQIDTYRAKGSSMGEAALSVIRGSDLAPWQHDVLESLEDSTQQVGVGHITQAEITVDRAASILSAARLKAERSDPEFFQLVISSLDRIWNQRPDNDGLFKHVTEARIELAMLRVAEKVPGSSEAAATKTEAASDPNLIPAVHRGVASGGENADGGADKKRVSIGAPRTIALNSTLNPAALGGNFLDATLMPDTAEILLAPGVRSLEDNVQVENLTIAGASQTLDSIRWSNVTFVGTRLRYEKGPLDLENVHFIRCTFGFPTDDRGARLADAIALGQTSFVSE